jgi:hypothetical protein
LSGDNHTLSASAMPDDFIHKSFPKTRKARVFHPWPLGFCWLVFFCPKNDGRRVLMPPQGEDTTGVQTGLMLFSYFRRSFYEILK